LQSSDIKKESTRRGLGSKRGKRSVEAGGIAPKV
jgi:hypothetical protein